MGVLGGHATRPLALLLAAVVVGFVACACGNSGYSENVDAVVGALRVRVSAELTPSERAALQQSVRDAGYRTMIEAREGAEHDVEVAASSGEGVLLEVPVAITEPFAPIDALTSAQLHELMETPGASWAAVGGPDVPVVLAGGQDPPANVVARVSATLGSLAVVPLDAVDASVRAIAIDGVDPLAGPDAARRYPLSRTALVRGEGDMARAASEIQRRFEERAGLQEPPQPVEIVALGTTLPARCSLAEIESTGDWAAPWRDTATIVQGADLVIANLEAVPSDLAEPYRCQETFSFLTPAAMAQGYAFAGLDVVSLANNHSRDFGGEVLLDGIANLRAAGVQVVGAGANAAEASAPLVVDVEGVRFAFLAYDNVVGEPYAASEGSPGTNPFDEARMVAEIRAVRPQADAVVVMLQWGLPEYYQDANAAQRAIAAAAVEAGADYVYGDGPHVPQGLEFRDGAFVHYSLGNFIFDQDWCEWTQVGSILRLTFHGGRPVAFRLVPYRIIDRHRPVPLSGADADAVVALIADATRQPSDAPARLLCEG